MNLDAERRVDQMGNRMFEDSGFLGFSRSRRPEKAFLATGKPSHSRPGA